MDFSDSAFDAREPQPGGAGRALALLAAVIGLPLAAVATSALFGAGTGVPHAGMHPPALVNATPPSAHVLRSLVADSLLGRSGKVLARFVMGPLEQSYPSIGNSQVTGAAVQTVEVAGLGPFSFVSMLPFREKRADRIGNYVVGFWPAELRRVTSTVYDNPDGFIEVTEANQHVHVSEHFMFSDFVTHNQDSIWPKYLVLQEPLLDKLELLIEDMKWQGVIVERVKVLSGFRTPYHNTYGIGSEGGARDSRHQFGDAADIIIDNDGDGRMDDLNRDRRVDIRDIDMIMESLDRIERVHPHLAGGLGRYHATGPSGPFVHVDVRGFRARWGNDPGRSTATASRAGQVAPGEARPMQRCMATSPLLCGRGG